GHATLATGCPPCKHGVIANDWYDRGVGEPVYCAGSERYELVPPRPLAKKKTKQIAGTPERLLAPTLADALKAATHNKAKVVSLSLKDRSAALPGGRRPDACYWFSTTSGSFVTSTYYRARLHPWVAKYNATRPADRWFGKPWTRLTSDLDYAKYSGPDDVAGEGKGYDQGRTFPHPMGKSAKKPGKEYYNALYVTPFGNDLLLGLVKEAVVAEGLGTRDVPDLLCVSFSS